MLHMHVNYPEECAVDSKSYFSPGTLRMQMESTVFKASAIIIIEISELWLMYITYNYIASGLLNVLFPAKCHKTVNKTAHPLETNSPQLEEVCFHS